jgi:hypothetical protein
MLVDVAGGRRSTRDVAILGPGQGSRAGSCTEDDVRRDLAVARHQYVPPSCLFLDISVCMGCITRLI